MSRHRALFAPGVLAVLAVLLPASPSPLSAQDLHPVVPGDRVRLSAQATSGEFLVSELRPDEVLVRSDSNSEIVRVPIRSVYGVELHEGRRSWFMAGLEGAAVGAAGGALISTHCGLTHVSCEVTSLEQALIGAGIGAVVSLLTRGGEQLWQEIRLPGQPVRTPPRAGGDRPRILNERSSGPRSIGTDDLRDLVDQGEDLYSLLQRIRPNWLRTRFVGGRREAPEVHMDGVPVGGLSALREYRVQDVRFIEFIDPNDASAPFDSIMGVISIRSGN